MVLGIWAAALFLLGTVKGGEVCYDDIGCFSNNSPWAWTLQRPLPCSPRTPEKINTRFLLYTRESPDASEEISAKNQSSITSSKFATSRKTRFIIHGYLENGYTGWPVVMCKRLLQVEDINCICVDWSGGSFDGYCHAANNVRVVGAQVAYMIDNFLNNFDYSLANIHIIGHSLGAQAAGEAGKRRPGIARLSGLDPAWPMFEDTPNEVRLDISDAMLVDVVHTDAFPLGLGTSQLCGHIDFFPNGGDHQPQCPGTTIPTMDNLLAGTLDIVACSHRSSFRYYIDSITNSSRYIAYPCESYKVFKSGGCRSCPSAGCPEMGHYADQYRGFTSSSQIFYLKVEVGESLS